MASPTKRLVLVAGNIGAGKTSITEMLGQQLGWQTGYETIEGNPYLGKFYGDMGAWSFHLQVFLLGQRAQQHLDAARHADSFIIDRSIYEDYHIFARALLELGNISAEDFATYERVYRILVPTLPRPDLLLYLKAPVEALVERIRARGRDIEGGISADYLALLDKYYEEWMAAYDLSPVLRVPSADWDFVNKPGHTRVVIEKIQEKLAGKEEVVFPENGG
jgi:deoxyadenosine/deoxycytidine kinase